MDFVSPAVSITRLRALRVNRSLLWTIFRIVLAMGLAGLVLTQIQINDLEMLWQRISGVWLLGSFLTFCAGIWVMARRYWKLLNQKVTFRNLLWLGVIQTVMGNLIATSVGAMTSITILRGKHQVGLSNGVGLFLIARFFDMVLLLITLTLSSWILWAQIQPLHWVVVLLGLALGGITVFTILLLTLRERWVRMVMVLSQKLSLHKVQPFARFLTIFSNLSNSDLSYLRAAFGSLTGYTILAFLLMLASTYCTLQLFGISMSIWQIVFILSLLLLSALVPIQILGGLGVQDVTSLYLYTLFGFSRPEMTAVIVGARLLFYLMNLSVLLYIPLEILLDRKRAAHTDD